MTVLRRNNNNSRLNRIKKKNRKLLRVLKKHLKKRNLNKSNSNKIKLKREAIIKKSRKLFQILARWISEWARFLLVRSIQIVRSYTLKLSILETGRSERLVLDCSSLFPLKR